MAESRGEAVSRPPIAMYPMPPPPPAQPPPGASFLPPRPPNPPPAPSLSVALSELKSLINLTETTLRALPSPLTTATSGAFVPCPFYPNHRVPPSSLFSHYLNCPSPLSLLHTFHYPLTLRSSSSTATTNLPTLPADSSDLTISLDDYTTFNAPANSFFYQNCPGPVTLIPSARPPLSFNLLRVLYIECADFDIGSSLKGFIDFSVDFIKFLPSEICTIRSETESWGGVLPACYSWRILRAVMKLRDCKLLHLDEWIIANSPRYGVIIDSPMRDHLVVLIKLCMKVIVREAFELVVVQRLKKEENLFSGLSNRSFDCPVLVKVMMWLALQFSILYGEVKAKYFAIDVLKECISNTAMRASVFPLVGEDAELNDGEMVQGDVEEQVKCTVSMDGSKRDEERETVGDSKIFISEVAAAVAALHERSLIEEKINALRNSQPLSAYQRNMEHAHLSNLAVVERQRCPDYRPIIEHDGFLRHRSNNQEGDKSKTREELLAEERDYKRRRMSYRGKKVKRNPLEVARDIIEEYMEEIRHAGEIGGISKAVEETEASTSENLDRHASATYVSGSSRNSETPEENRGFYNDYTKDLRSRHYSGDLKDDNQWSGQDSTRDHGRQYPNRNVESVGYDRDDHYGSRDGRLGSYTKEQGHVGEKKEFVDAFAEDYSRRSHRRKNEERDEKHRKRSRDDNERRTYKRGKDEHERTSRKRERDEDNWEHGNRGRSKTDGASRKRDEDEGGHADRRKSKTHRHRTSSRELHEFEDRYDPAESHH
ncbi:hypothetical protein ACS0TY_005005 [Phlomoides rotata]